MSGELPGELLSALPGLPSSELPSELPGELLGELLLYAAGRASLMILGEFLIYDVRWASCQASYRVSFCFTLTGKVP